MLYDKFIAPQITKDRLSTKIRENTEKRKDQLSFQSEVKEHEFISRTSKCMFEIDNRETLSCLTFNKFRINRLIEVFV